MRSDCSICNGNKYHEKLCKCNLTHMNNRVQNCNVTSLSLGQTSKSDLEKQALGQTKFLVEQIEIPSDSTFGKRLITIFYDNGCSDSLTTINPCSQIVLDSRSIENVTVSGYNNIPLFMPEANQLHLDLKSGGLKADIRALSMEELMVLLPTEVVVPEPWREFFEEPRLYSDICKADLIIGGDRPDLYPELIQTY